MAVVTFFVSVEAGGWHSRRCCGEEGIPQNILYLIDFSMKD